jgi:hypothetical protein
MEERIMDNGQLTMENGGIPNRQSSIINCQSTPEPEKDYYERKERRNDELIVTMVWAIGFGFGLGVLYVAARLIVGAAEKIL